MCTTLGGLMDLSVSWVQQVDSGRLTGRSIEVVEAVGIRSVKDAETTWALYQLCNNAQQCLLRRYHASFNCDGKYYFLREVTYTPDPPAAAPLVHVLAQLLELFSSPGALPENFIHGNPTISSLSFIGRLPVALRHRIPCEYSSRHLIQVDFGGADSAALTALASRQLGEESQNAIVIKDGQLTVKSEATFSSFLREYPRHSKIIALHMLSRAALTFYEAEEVKAFLDVFPQGACNAKNLREIFEQIKGSTIPVDLVAELSPRLIAQLQ
jgi:hypothetical protein